MVLINTVTVEAINTALIALQRGQSITIGGEKGGTVNNINVTNNGTGSGTDVSPQLNALDKRVTEVENENERQNERIEGLEGLGIESVEFEEGSRTLFIYLVNGDVLDVVIPDRPLSLTLNGTTLTLSSDGETLSNVELPFIPSSEKGVAGGVATLDSSGRIPYSQLPESAMEFKGTWNASTNDPHLEDGTGTNGDFYVCTMPGTATFGPGNTVSFIQNDRVIYDGATSKWIKLLAGQVSTVNGMSGDVVLNGTNVNYSDAVNSPTLKNKIDAIETMADTQVDWNESNSSSLAFIKNKPTIPDAQVQSDWTQTNSAQKDFIKNKIPIWIRNGSSGEDMSPIDSVVDGNMRPVTSNAVYDKVQKLYPSSATLLSATDDLNNIKTEGLYYCNGAVLPLNAPSGTVANLYNCIIKVSKQGNVARYVQEFYTLNGNTYYSRTCGVSATDVWSDWERLEKASEINTLVNIWTNSIVLSTQQWVKICEFGTRPYGSTLELELGSEYRYYSNGSHIIKITYGWTDCTVEDNANDPAGVFDKIRVCWQGNNTDKMALYVHYNMPQANNTYYKIRGNSVNGITRIFQTSADPTTYANNKEISLGLIGKFINGERVATKSDLSKCIQQSNNLTNSTFGYAVDETVPFESFITKVVQLYGEGWRNIKFFWANAQSFKLSFGNGITFSISGAELFGYFETLYPWRVMNFIFIDSSGTMWRLLCSRSSSETITTSARQVAFV